MVGKTIMAPCASRSTNYLEEYRETSTTDKQETNGKFFVRYKSDFLDHLNVEFGHAWACGDVEEDGDDAAVWKKECSSHCITTIH